MFDTNALRQRAREWHDRLRRTIPTDSNDAAPIATAEQMLMAAAKETGVERAPVRPGDTLLAGAHAVLNRDYPIVYYAQGAGVSAEQQRFAQAHEYAHYWLHPELDYDACLAADDGQMLLSLDQRTPDRQFETGYGPAERRESEANLFAAELLLPAHVLREGFIKHGWRADRIAAHTGLTETCVLTQLASSLLLPLPTKRETRNKPVNEAESDVSKARAAVVGAVLSPENALQPTCKLDDSQRAAAHWEGGPLLIEAGPGTGKTRTLVARIVYLLTERSVAPENILALTFSNKAAAEMRSRLRTAVGASADRVWIGTFHAFGCEILRKDGGMIGLPAKPKLLERADAVSLLANHLDRLPLDQFEYLNNPAYAFPAILNCISRAKSELVTPEDYRKLAEQQKAEVDTVQPTNQPAGGKAPTQKEADEAEKQRSAPIKSLEIAAVYAVYQRLLHERGLLDYGDMLMRAVELLEAFPEVCERWQNTYPHVLADEYQDINRASGRLLQKIAGNKTRNKSDSRAIDDSGSDTEYNQDRSIQSGLNNTGGLWAVGDPRQAIYRFMGASPANLREFERDFPGGARLSLERNYRSQPPVVALFGKFATQMFGASGQFAEWYAERANTDSATTITLAIADDEAAQADGIAADLRSREQAGVSLTDQAILCRTNRQASDLAALLEARGIPTQHLGDLWERAEIKDLLAVLSLACEPEGTTLGRVAAFPQYAVPQADVLTLLHHARAVDCPFPKAMSLIEMETETLPELSETGRVGLQKLWSDLQPLCYRGDAWRFLSRYLFTTSDYLLPLLTDDSPAAEQKKAAIHQLLQSALGIAPRFDSINKFKPQDAQAAFLEHLRHLLACREARSILTSDSASGWYGVPLMTVHQSKGLEFPVVFLPSLIQGQFPPRKQGSQAVVPPGLATGTSTDGGTDGGDGEESDDEDETGEECLFFVALSRARDALILCQPVNWNGKSAKPSPLLERLNATLKAVGTQEVAWHIQRTQENDLPVAAESDNSIVIDTIVPDSGIREKRTVNRDSAESGKENSTYADGDEEKLTLSVAAVEQYQKCPRRYYYSRVLKLPERGERSPYLAFHNSLYETIGWMQAECMDGNSPTLANANAYMSAEMARHGDLLTGSHGRVLRDRAAFMLAGAHRRTKESHELREPLPLVAHLPNGNIQLKCDQLEQTENGSLRLIDYTLSRPKSDDHTKPRLALLRHATTQQNPDKPTQIFIGYLRPAAQGEQSAQNELKEVQESKRFEPARIDKYDLALQGIRTEKFEPNPSQECSVCPYFILCPA